jgi:signal transduction histidine kinase/CheY-like chemotaxis protein
VTDLDVPRRGLDPHELLRANAELQQRLEALARESRHKSEFLANLSHELRTPLNSLLILAQLLAENAAGNLTAKQVEYAQTICVAGNELLALVNDILDMAKVESGTVSLSLGTVRLDDLREQVERSFRQIARDKGLAFRVSMGKGLPAAIRTDTKRLRQILHNLLSNAFKFTEHGEVTLKISRAARGRTRRRTDAAEVLTFAVADTGIGIAKDKQNVIFDAFRQSDGTTARRFGGTGLGLTISADLARLLGGEILVESSPGKGSTFALRLPIRPAAPSRGARPQDDRDSIRPGDHVVLVVARDRKLAAALLEQVRSRGLKGLSAANAHTALALANERLPSAAVFAVRPRDVGDWAGLGWLKQDPDTQHIPISVVCVDPRERIFVCLGALGLVTGPSGRQALSEAVRRLGQSLHRRLTPLLVASAGKDARKAVAAALAQDGMRVVQVASGRQALKVLGKPGIEGLVIGQTLTDMLPLELVGRLVQSGRRPRTPIIVAGRNAQAEMLVLTRLSSAEAVLEQAGQYLHDAMQDMLPGHSRPRPGCKRAGAPLANAKALIVDDDARSLFALSSILEREGMQVLTASSGSAGLDALRQDPGIDLILMDLLMPHQDGYQTIRQVRDMAAYRHTPIIGVSARAMKGDREKCIAAGASDYIAKPVDLEQLKSLMRMWLADKPAAERPRSAQMRTTPL